VRGATRIDFHKGPTTRYRSALHRHDGVTVALDRGEWDALAPGEDITRTWRA
jgi:hypothetical protein